MTENHDAPPFVHRRLPVELSDDRYPTLPAARPPKELGHREARTWRRQQRQARASTLAAWRNRAPGSTDGLGVVLLVVAVILCAIVFLRPDSQPATASTPSAPSAASGSTSDATPASPADTPSTPLAAPDPALPPPFDVAGGTTAQTFLTGYLTYNPGQEDPAAAWIDSWSTLATGEVERTATTAVARLWDFAVQQQLQVSPGPITGTATVGSRQVIFDVQAGRLLTPLDGSPATVDTVGLRITVVGDRVTNVQSALTGISE